MQHKIIKKSEAKVIDLGTKNITKYSSGDKTLEINHMKINGRHPENPTHFVLETKVHFLVYVIAGTGEIYCDNNKYIVKPGDVVDVPPHTKFAVEGKNLEYLALQSPAWFPEQAFIVDSQNNIIEQTQK